MLRSVNELRRAALYVRVSTEDQDLDHQEEDLRAELARRGWELATVSRSPPGTTRAQLQTEPAIYREKASGANPRRPELARLLADAARHRFDAVLVWSIDRVGRNALEVLTTAEELYKRGVALVSLRETAVDLTSPMGRLVLEVGAAFAAFERRRLSERTRSGMEGARRRGVHVGRPPAELQPDQVAWLADQQGVSFAARAFNVSRATVRKYRDQARERTASGAGGPLLAKTGPSEG